MAEQLTNEEKPKFLSMMDIEADTEELIGYNPEADANADIPPVPAGRYSFIARFQEEDAEKRFVPGVWAKGTANEQKVIYSNIVLELYNTPGAEYDKRVVFDMVSTFTVRGTNDMQGFLQCVGKGEELKTDKSRRALVLLFNETVAAGAAVGEVELEWEAQEPMTKEERQAAKDDGRKVWTLSRMASFPPALDADKKPIPGVYLPEAVHNGQVCKARNVVKKYITYQGEGGSAGVEQHQDAVPVAPTPAPRPQAAPPRAQAPQGVPQAAPVPQGPPVPPRAQAPRPVASGRK